MLLMFVAAEHFLQCGSISVLKHTMAISAPKLEVSDGPESLLPGGCQQSSSEQQKVDVALQTSSGCSTSDDMNQLWSEPAKLEGRETELNIEAGDRGDISSSSTVSIASKSQPAVMVTAAVAEQQVSAAGDASLSPALVMSGQNEAAATDELESVHHAGSQQTDDVPRTEAATELDTGSRLVSDADAAAAECCEEVVDDQSVKHKGNSTSSPQATGSDAVIDDVNKAMQIAEDDADVKLPCDEDAASSSSEFEHVTKWSHCTSSVQPTGDEQTDRKVALQNVDADAQLPDDGSDGAKFTEFEHPGGSLCHSSSPQTAGDISTSAGDVCEIEVATENIDAGDEVKSTDDGDDGAKSSEFEHVAESLLQKSLLQSTGDMETNDVHETEEQNIDRDVGVELTNDGAESAELEYITESLLCRSSVQTADDIKTGDVHEMTQKLDADDEVKLPNDRDAAAAKFSEFEHITGSLCHRSSPQTTDDEQTDLYESAAENIDADDEVKLPEDGDVEAKCRELEHVTDQMSTNEQTLTDADIAAGQSASAEPCADVSSVGEMPVVHNDSGVPVGELGAVSEEAAAVSVLVSDIPQGLEETVEMYLESRKKGGGTIESFKYDRRSGSALVVFADSAGDFVHVLFQMDVIKR